MPHPGQPEYYDANAGTGGDDTAAVQAALNSSEPVKVLSRVYRADRLEHSQSNTEIVWLPGAKLFKPPSTYQAGVPRMMLYIHGTNTNQRIENVKLTNPVLDGNHTQQGNVPFDAAFPYNNLNCTYIDGLTIDGGDITRSCHNGYGGGANSAVKISGLKSRWHGKNCIYTSDLVDDVVIDGVTCEESNFDFGYGRYTNGSGAELGYAGISAASLRTRIVNSAIRNCAKGIAATFTGIPAQNAEDCIVSGNTVSDCRQQLLHVGSYVSVPPMARRAVVSANILRNSLGVGALVQGCKSAVFNGNTIMNCASLGLSLNNAGEDIAVNGNLITDGGSSGIALIGVTGFALVGNVIRRHPRAAIEFFPAGASKGKCQNHSSDNAMGEYLGQQYATGVVCL